MRHTIKTQKYLNLALLIIIKKAPIKVKINDAPKKGPQPPILVSGPPNANISDLEIDKGNFTGPVSEP